MRTTSPARSAHAGFWGLLVAGIVAATAWSGCGYFRAETSAAPGIEYHKVGRGDFLVTVVEAGTLASTSKLTLVNEMEGASTIVEIIAEGTQVKGPRSQTVASGDTLSGLAQRFCNNSTAGLQMPVLEFEEVLRRLNRTVDWDKLASGSVITLPGDLLVKLDPNTLAERIASQDIVVTKAQQSVTNAMQELDIVKLSTAATNKAASIALTNAVAELEKFRSSDAPTQRQDYSGKISVNQKEIDLAQTKLVAYAELERAGFASTMEVKREEANVARSQHDIKMLRASMSAYDLFDFPIKEREMAMRVEQREIDKLSTEQKSAANLASSQISVRTADKTLKLEQQKLAELEDQLGKSRIFAPQEGLVVYAVDAGRFGASSSLIRQGETTRRGQELIRLPRTDSLMVEVKIHESVRRMVREGMRAYVKIDSVPGKPLKAVLKRVAPVPDSTSRFQANVKVFNSEVWIEEALPEGISTGLSASAEIVVKQLVDVVKVPVQCVITVQGRTLCFVQGAKGPEAREVEVGFYDQKFIEIKKGLDEGELVMLSPSSAGAALNIEGSVIQDKAAAGQEASKAAPVPAPNGGVAKTGGPGPAQPAPGGDGMKGPPGGGGGSGFGGAGGGGGRRGGVDTAQLNLTEEQKPKFEAAQQKLTQKIREVFTSGVAREEMMAAMQKPREEFAEEIKGFLKAEQVQKYEELEAQMRQQFQGGGGGFGGGAGGPKGGGP